MAKTNLPEFLIQLFTDAGAVAANYLLYTYQSGTTTPLNTWTDAAGTTLNANPIVLDSGGRCTIFGGTSAYTFVLKTPGGAVVWTRNDIFALPVASSGSFVPIEGDVDMTGQFRLSGNATDNLNPVPLQQANSLIATAIASEVTARNTAITAAIGTSHGQLLRITYLTASATWTKGSDVGSIDVHGRAGGGGVGAVPAGCGGGGAGGSFRKRIAAPAASYPVVIGDGGSNSGTDGGVTTFDTCTANGGKGATGVAGGLGGTATGGDINLTGGGGSYGGSWSANVYFGTGGNSDLGGGAIGNLNNANGSPGAPNTGGGASGGMSSGAAGGSGSVIIYEYS